MAKQLKKWQGWLLFGGAMAIIFILGMLCSSMLERRAEVASVFNNRRTVMTDSIVSQNEKFAEDFPKEYQTWAMTEDTSFVSKYNSSQEVDVLAQRPEMVILWAGYAFSREYNTPRGHRHAVEDLRKILRTGSPGVDGQEDMQPGTCWTCKGPDVPRLMREKGKNAFYAAKWSQWGNEVMNSVGCSDCHDARNMDLRPARPALYEAWQRAGKDVKKQATRKCVHWFVHSATLSIISKRTTVTISSSHRIRDSLVKLLRNIMTLLDSTIIYTHYLKLRF